MSNQTKQAGELFDSQVLIQLRCEIETACDRFRDQCEHLTKSGALDKSEPYFVQAIISAALKDTADAYRPFTPEGREAVKNLSHF